MRSLANGEKDFEKYPKILKKNFVFLNEYTTSVQAEHDPRGPEGPYRFVDRSVPVVLFKRWDGETLVQQLGFGGGPKAFQRLLDRALKKNGPVSPPKALKPLLKAHKKGMEHLEKGRVGSAVRELQKVVKGAQNKKKFEVMPPVGVAAEEQLQKLKAQGEELLAQAQDLAGRDPKASKKEYNRIRREYGKLPGLDAAIKAALKALPD